MENSKFAAESERNEDPLMVSLAKIEIQAFTEISYSKLQIDEGSCNVWQASYESGVRLFKLISNNSTFSEGEQLFIDDLIVLMESSPYLSDGYEFAKDSSQFCYQNKQIEHYEENDIFYREELLVSKAYAKEVALNATVKDLAESLIPHLDTLKEVKKYSDLLALDKPVLEILVQLESDLVVITEQFNDYIDGSTSGHHRDCLNIYTAALDGITDPWNGYVYMGEDGTLYFSIAETITFHSVQNNSSENRA